ncbi:MAG: cytochrome c oxidase subunit II [Candidatus Promineifilaceae bacterium]
MKSNRTHLSIVTALVVITSVVVYFLLDKIYQLPVEASAESVPIDQLIHAHFIMIAILFSLIMVFMVYSAFAFRKKEGDETDGVHFHGHTGLEIGWTVLPLVTVIGFGVWGAVVLKDVTGVKANEMVVNVTGQQWSWSFSYPDYEDVGQTPELVLPVNQTIRLHMNSQDVLHSFWIPEFRVKQDLVPGMETTLRITPTEIGEYKVRCAEICGFGHSTMRAVVRVVNQSDFEAWVQEQSVSIRNLSPEERGSKWAVDFGCAACHSTDGSAGVGPTWAGLFGRNEVMSDGSTITIDEAYIQESIYDPNAHVVNGFSPDVMPGNFEERMTTMQNEEAAKGNDINVVDDLIAYIKTLSAPGTEE